MVKRMLMGEAARRLSDRALQKRLAVQALANTRRRDDLSINGLHPEKCWTRSGLR